MWNDQGEIYLGNRDFDELADDVAQDASSLREWNETKVTASSGCLHCGDKNKDGHKTEDCPFLSQEKRRQVAEILSAPVRVAKGEEARKESDDTIAIDSAATHCTSTAGAAAKHLRDVQKADRPLKIEGNIPGANTSTHLGTVGPVLKSYIDPASKSRVWFLSRSLRELGVVFNWIRTSQ